MKNNIDNLINKVFEEGYNIKKERIKKLKTLGNDNDKIVVVAYLKRENREYLYFLWHQFTHHIKRVARVGNKIYGFHEMDELDHKNIDEHMEEFSGNLEFLKDIEEIEWVKNIETLQEKGVNISQIKPIIEVEHTEER